MSPREAQFPKKAGTPEQSHVMAVHRYVSCLVLSALVLNVIFVVAEDNAVAGRLWRDFNRARTNDSAATTEDVAVRFLQRFTCFTTCHRLSDKECVLSERLTTIQRLELKNESDLQNLSTILLDHVLQSGPKCDESHSACKQASECTLHHLASNEPENLELLLSNLKQIHRPPPYQGKCFEASDLHHDLHTNEKERNPTSTAKNLAVALFVRLYQGECIKSNYETKTAALMHDATIDFVGSIFNKYNKSSSLSLEDLEKLMVDVGIVRHDHGHVLHEDEEHDDHDGHDHSKHADTEELPNPSQRTKRDLGKDQHDHPSHTMPNTSEECWTANQLFTHFDVASLGEIDENEFHSLCPALIQQRLHGSCVEKLVLEERSTLEIYGYGTLAVFLISFCSVLGVVLMPIQNSSMYQYVMICFIALAFGTLTGDALLHLIPEAVGLHTHDESGGHNHEDEALPASFWKFLAILGSVYGLFVFEGIADLAVHGIHTHEHGKSGGHGHSHIPSIDLVQMTRKDVKTVSSETLDSTISGPAMMNGDVPSAEPRQSVISEGPQNTKMCCGMTTLALVIIIGDAIHNVADGLTIGAAFSSSTKGGISSALAIFFHELPHEFGDFVILLSTGFTFKKALIWNFAASLTAFIGLYVGLGVGENEDARQWILTVAAGMFLYIAVGDMLPELKNQKGENGLISFIVQNIGVLIGITCMILMSVFEDKIKV